MESTTPQLNLSSTPTERKAEFSRSLLEKDIEESLSSLFKVLLVTPPLKFLPLDFPSTHLLNKWKSTMLWEPTRLFLNSNKSKPSQPSLRLLRKALSSNNFKTSKVYCKRQLPPKSLRMITFPKSLSLRLSIPSKITLDSRRNSPRLCLTMNNQFCFLRYTVEKVSELSSNNFTKFSRSC